MLRERTEEIEHPLNQKEGNSSRLRWLKQRFAGVSALNISLLSLCLLQQQKIHKGQASRNTIKFHSLKEIYILILWIHVFVVLTFYLHKHNGLGIFNIWPTITLKKNAK